MAPDKGVQAKTEGLNHVAHVREALKGFLGRDVRVQGVLTDPAVMNRAAYIAIA